VILEGYLYVLGGEDGTSRLRSVERALINGDGSLGLWLAVSPMTTERDSIAAATGGRYIYAVGGYSGGTGISSVEYALIIVDP
jgi:hypothetical protein